jgi:competence protein ComEC
LILVAPLWSRRLVARGWPKPLADALCVAAAAQLVTAPLIAAISGQVSVVGIAANIAAAVVIPPITVVGTGAAVLAPMWRTGAGLMIRFTGPELWWLLHVAHLAGAVPGAALAVPRDTIGVVAVGVGTLAAILLWHRVANRQWARRLAASALILLIAWLVAGALSAAPGVSASHGTIDG